MIIYPEHLSSIAMPITSIYLDMDGVLCDWYGRVLSVSGIDPDSLDWSQGYWTWRQLDHSLVTDKVNAIGPKFWEDMDPLPHAMDLWKLSNSVASTSILSAPWDSCPDSYKGKTLWIKKHLGHEVKRIFTNQKFACGGAGKLLIDDSFHHCQSFSDAGGLAIHCPTDRFSGSLSIEQILSFLEALALEKGNGNKEI